MTVQHHISDELLLAYAAGNLSEGWSLAVATHLALCPQCRRKLAKAEAVGGAMLETLEAATVEPSALDAVMTRIDTEPLPEATRSAPAKTEGDLTFPEPLRSYLGGGRRSRLEMAGRR